MKNYLLDTNTVSHLLKKHPQGIRRLLAVPMTSLSISAIPEGELLFGLATTEFCWPTSSRKEKPLPHSTC